MGDAGLRMPCLRCHLSRVASTFARTRRHAEVLRTTQPARVFIKLSYTGNMVVSGYTGCRLPEAKRAAT